VKKTFKIGNKNTRIDRIQYKKMYILLRFDSSESPLWTVGDSGVLPMYINLYIYLYMYIYVYINYKIRS